MFCPNNKQTKFCGAHGFGIDPTFLTHGFGEAFLTPKNLGTYWFLMRLVGHLSYVLPSADVGR
ncbi:MAG TPA: hypothetical protein DHV03_05860 [Alphaproteobacteria bacterium]|nr:hypothetical protein [Paracoccaceae bacterium]HCY48190.1 hypothetical protein [Alphaproteobacteria bacterium]